MHDLERHLILVQEFFRKLLQRQQFIGAQVTLVVRSSLARQDRFFQIIHAARLQIRNQSTRTTDYFFAPVHCGSFSGATISPSRM